MERVRFDGSVTVFADAGTTILVFNSAVTVEMPRQSLTASRFDALVDIEPGTSLSLTADGQGRC
jgi:hypothetical protein